MQIELRELTVNDLPRIGEVDRTEMNAARHIARRSEDGLSLTLTREVMDPPGYNPPWSEEGIERRMNLWRPELEQDGVFVGAFDGEKFAGFAILGHMFRDKSAELAAIFVDAAYRRTGIGAQLVREIERRAVEKGIEALFVHANWTESAVKFYLKHGYRILALSDNSVVKHKKGDPEFAKALTEEVRS
ncbi:GNAT family N-acetyltransferase [Candidatus Hydrogenedentota bacterium]